MKKQLIHVVIALALILMVNLLSNQFYKRFDLTEDRRFTLSEEAIQTAEKFDNTVIIDVLLGGNLPPQFNKLKTESLLLLEQFKSKNNNITYNLVDPLEDMGQREKVIADLQQIGLTPANVTSEEDGVVSQELVFPWAMVNYGNNTVRVPLLKNKLGSSPEELMNNSVQQLEYAFADAFT